MANGERIQNHVEKVTLQLYGNDIRVTNDL